MRRMTKIAGLVAGMGIAGYGGAFAEKGTAEQREACTPDAFRLCIMSMPDEGAVEQCLRQAGPRLSPACYAVFNPPQPDMRETRPLPPAVGNAYARQPDPASRNSRPVRPLPAPQSIAPSVGGDDD